MLNPVEKKWQPAEKRFFFHVLFCMGGVKQMMQREKHNIIFQPWKSQKEPRDVYFWYYQQIAARVSHHDDLRC